MWEEIHGFVSPEEYDRFVLYIEDQVKSGVAEEITPDSNYGKGEIYGGRWFKDLETGKIWRLVPPDFPFRGLWESVRVEGEASKRQCDKI
jgi:hypothetical protein